MIRFDAGEFPISKWDDVGSLAQQTKAHAVNARKWNHLEQLPALPQSHSAKR